MLKVIPLMLLLSLVFNMSLFSMEQEIDGVMNIYECPFSYAKSDFFQKVVDYSIPLSIPIFEAFIEGKKTSIPSEILFEVFEFPITCLFIGRKNIESQEPIAVIINGKRYIFSAYRSHSVEMKNGVVIRQSKDIPFKDRYKSFIKKDTIKDYLAFMEELKKAAKVTKIREAQLNAVKSENKNKESYLNLLPTEIIALLEKNKYLQEPGWIRWGHLNPLLEYHEQVLKEIEQEKMVQ